jgi:flagellar secretion chaperone FliS
MSDNGADVTQGVRTDVNHGAQAYSRLDITTAVESANSQQLVKLMLDGALARLIRAKGCINHRDIEGRNDALTTGLGIIGALQGCLDHERGGSLAANLDSLYDYMQRRLFRANVDNDLTAIDEVIDLVRTLKDAWDAIDDVPAPRSAATMSR